MSSTPGVELDDQRDHWEHTQESAKGALRLKNFNYWQHPPSGRLTLKEGLLQNKVIFEVRFTSKIRLKDHVLKKTQG